MAMRAWMVLSVLSVLSCTPVVHRWNLGGKERHGSSVGVRREANVLSDYVWLTPPVESRRLAFEDGRASLSFAGETIGFSLAPGGELTLQRHGEQLTARPQRSERNLYPDVRALGTRTVARQRLVYRSRMVSKTVPVSKTRFVSKSVPVMRTRSVSYYDSSSKSTQYRTESYTEYQTQSVSETYTAYESRSVWEPYTEWITVNEQVVDIPEYEYFTFDWAPGWPVLVYRTARAEGGQDYWFQNPSYLAASDDARDALTGAARVLAIDANSNGVYFEESDRLLFNSWNPYRQDSRYAEVHGFLDDYWYSLADLARHHLVWGTLSADQRSLTFESPNARFAGDRGRSKVRVSALPPGAQLSFNGTRYRARGATFEAEIEHGVYLVTVSAPGAGDWTETITLDRTMPLQLLTYRRPTGGGTLSVDNLSLQHWRLIVLDPDGSLVTLREDTQQVTLPPGQYEVLVRSEGYDLRARVTISPQAPVRLDYDALVRAREAPSQGS